MKGIIQQPRPIFNSDKVTLLKTHAKEYFLFKLMKIIKLNKNK